jgi:L-2,4-diaminobutyrate decarboxylase
MNQSLAVWEMSPIATAIDRDLMSRFKKLFAYPRGAEGSLVPGGAFANLTALLAARDALEPGASRSGKARIALVVGAQAHYSVARAAVILGLGSDAVFRVPLNLEFCTDIARTHDLFAAARKSGFRKFILIASAGSTSTGSFDDIASASSDRHQLPSLASRGCRPWCGARLQPSLPVETERHWSGGLDYI